MTKQLAGPDWISPPGETILDILEERGWSQADLAERMDYSPKHINFLIKGTAGITEDAALKLERVLGSTAGFWLNREAQYREALARKAELADLKPFVSWLAELPVADMVRFGWIQKHSQRVKMVAACLQFFGVASVPAWYERYSALGVAYRTSPVLAKKNGSVAAWIRMGEVQAEERSAGIFNRQGFLNLIPQLRAWTIQDDPVLFLPNLERALASVGIVLVVAQTPRGCPVSGITKWLSPDKALIMLSFRHKTNDHFWFSLFHELGHLVLHGKKLSFMEGLQDGLNSEQEVAADRWAVNLLIPATYNQRLKKMALEKQEIIKFAQDLKIAPGIVVGRLQHDKRLDWAVLNELKVYYKWLENT